MMLLGPAGEFTAFPEKPHFYANGEGLVERQDLFVKVDQRTPRHGTCRTPANGAPAAGFVPR